MAKLTGTLNKTVVIGMCTKKNHRTMDIEQNDKLNSFCSLTQRCANELQRSSFSGKISEVTNSDMSEFERKYNTTK